MSYKIIHAIGCGINIYIVSLCYLIRLRDFFTQITCLEITHDDSWLNVELYLPPRFHRLYFNNGYKHIALKLGMLIAVSWVHLLINLFLNLKPRAVFDRKTCRWEVHQGSFLCIYIIYVSGTG